MVKSPHPGRGVNLGLLFFFKQKTAYEMLRSLVGSEMCIRDRADTYGNGALGDRALPGKQP